MNTKELQSLVSQMEIAAVPFYFKIGRWMAHNWKSSGYKREHFFAQFASDYILKECGFNHAAGFYTDAWLAVKKFSQSQIDICLSNGLSVSDVRYLAVINDKYREEKFELIVKTKPPYHLQAKARKAYQPKGRTNAQEEKAIMFDPDVIPIKTKTPDGVWDDEAIETGIRRLCSSVPRRILSPILKSAEKWMPSDLSGLTVPSV